MVKGLNAFGRRPLHDDAAGASAVLAIIILVAVVSVLGATLFFVASNIAAQDLQARPYANAIPVAGNNTEFQFILLGGQREGYSIDPATARFPELVIINVDGNDCLFAEGEFRIEGPDREWNVGERLSIFKDDCGGGPLTHFRTYAVAIALGDILVFQGTLRPGEGQ